MFKPKETIRFEVFVLIVQAIWSGTCAGAIRFSPARAVTWHCGGKCVIKHNCPNTIFCSSSLLKIPPSGHKSCWYWITGWQNQPYPSTDMLGARVGMYVVWSSISGFGTNDRIYLQLRWKILGAPIAWLSREANEEKVIVTEVVKTRGHPTFLRGAVLHWP